MDRPDNQVSAGEILITSTPHRYIDAVLLRCGYSQEMINEIREVQKARENVRYEEPKPAPAKEKTLAVEPMDIDDEYQSSDMEEVD